MKIVGIILGVLLIVGGCFCIATPLATFATLGWLVGIAMLADGIGSVITWNERKQAGLADNWSLAGAILSAVLGIFVLCSSFLRIGIDAFFAYLLAFWLVMNGVVRIMSAIQLHRLNQTDARVGNNWLLLLIVGILVVIAGVFCVFNPMIAVVSAGVLMGVSVLMSGISLITISVLA